MSNLSSAEIVCSIDDLLTQILLRLPIISLLRFKSVSIHWFSIITNPFFSCRKTNPPNGLFFTITGQYPYNYIPSSSSSLYNAPPSTKILQSCNGLLLCTDQQTRTFYVYNPTTNRSTLIPQLHKPGFSFGKTLAFNPVKSPFYKLVFVRLILLNTGNTFQIQIYSSDTGCWILGGELNDTRKLQFDHGVYCNGSIHWLSSELIGNSLRFHVDTQVFDEMPTPPFRLTSNWRGDYYFLESFDQLYFIEPGSCFNVYEMKRDYSEWYVKYCVDLSPVISAYGLPRVRRHLYQFTILSLIRDEKESILVLRIPGKLLKYNLVDGSFDKLIDFEEYLVNGTSRYLDATGFVFVPSLSCV